MSGRWEGDIRISEKAVVVGGGGVRGGRHCVMFTTITPPL